MLRQVFSKVNGDTLLVSILSPAEEIGRIDSATANEILQVSTMRLPQNKVIKAHKHVGISRTTVGTQETWVLISGQIKASIFDTNDLLVEEVTLDPGMCMTLYNGGHNFEVISTDAVIFEIKNGPYYGAELDSQRID